MTRSRTHHCVEMTDAGKDLVISYDPGQLLRLLGPQHGSLLLAGERVERDGITYRLIHTVEQTKLF